MKILSNNQIREIDQKTIERQNITSLELMERAGKKITNELYRYLTDKQQAIIILCGPGNNGGDGWVIAREMYINGYNVQVFNIRYGDKVSSDNFQMESQAVLAGVPVSNITLQDAVVFPSYDYVFIDCLFGTGLSRPLQLPWSDLITKINHQEKKTISVDIPSGMFADQPNAPTDAIVRADIVLSIELPKLNLLLPETGAYALSLDLVSIGLDETAIREATTDKNYITNREVSLWHKQRGKFTHKGTYGHAFLMAGSYGKIGAAVLAARACINAGVGLLTVQTPKCGYAIIQSTVPEAMCEVDEQSKFLSTAYKLTNYDAVGIGPGIGENKNTQKLLQTVLATFPGKIVLDADAINIISKNQDIQHLLNQRCVLTPHPKEFQRLVGKWRDDYEKLALLKKFCIKHSCVVLLKGAHSIVCTPAGELSFNSTGNAGMATAGSGDVLTGIVLSFLAQGYSTIEASILAMYIHGLSADLLAEQIGVEAITANKIIKKLGKAFKYITQTKV